jgi:hypothetical protein
MDSEVSVDAVDPKTVLPYGLQMPPASNKGDIHARLCQSPTKISSHTACAKYNDTHLISPSYNLLKI